jgi:hypothetical protein
MIEMVSWQQRETLEQERHADRLRRSEMSRVVKQAQMAKVRNVFHCRALTRLGYWLVVWGASLQQRYGSRAPASALGHR